jgi:hypothetical protein
MNTSNNNLKKFLKLDSSRMPTDVVSFIGNYLIDYFVLDDGL